YAVQYCSLSAGEREEEGEADPFGSSIPAGLESHLEGDLQRSERNRLSENTRLATRYAVRIFREYLSEKAQSPDFETLDKEALCAVLRSFYAEARSKSGQLYSKSSLISIRSSLNRYLNEPPYCRTLDLTKDPELRSANLTLAAVIRRLEEQGAGPVVQKQAITRSDLRKLYESSVFNTDTPFGLLNKVWFETCMYFCTRGRENQRELEEDSFGLAVDEDGRKFVYFKALGPRRPDADEDTLPRMYETGTEQCPYASFVRYVSKRNPLCRAFFQRPRDHCCASDVTWYENKAIGKNLLGTRMQMLSRAAKLSKTYTNHCIGAVSIATLNSIVGATGSRPTTTLYVASETVNGHTQSPDSNNKHISNNISSNNNNNNNSEQSPRRGPPGGSLRQEALRAPRDTRGVACGAERERVGAREGEGDPHSHTARRPVTRRRAHTGNTGRVIVSHPQQSVRKIRRRHRKRSCTVMGSEPLLVIISHK
uniref:ZMYM2-like/QRICH1 C-terminal domain-containing protein n=1 Tax=Dicentrarchus labrax TaxID=13489 RepID=A0A8C4F437_DICLA